MLNKKLVNRHLVLRLGRNLWHTSKETLTSFWQGLHLVTPLWKVQLERRVGDDIVHLFRMTIGSDGISLHDIVNGVLQSVQDKIETEEIRWFLRDILTIDSGLIHADTTSQVHEQGSRTSWRVIDPHVLRLIISHQDIRDNLGHRVRRVVLSVLATTVFVVVLDHILKESREKVKTLWKNGLIKLNASKKIDDSLSDLVPLTAIWNSISNQALIKETNSCISFRMDREDIVIVYGDLVESIFKSFVESRFVLLTVEGFDQLVRLEPSSAGTDKF